LKSIPNIFSFLHVLFIRGGESSIPRLRAIEVDEEDEDDDADDATSLDGMNVDLLVRLSFFPF
jgi:hypothetical protein